MNKEDKLLGIVALFCFVGFCVSMVIISASLDIEKMSAYERYEECVLEQYGTTPTAWMVDNGEYPICK